MRNYEQEYLSPDERAEARAQAALNRIIAPLDFESFLKKHWNRDLLVQAAPDHGRYHHLVGWECLNKALEQQRFSETRLQLMRRGKSIAAELYTYRRAGEKVLDAGAVNALLAQGATLVLSFVDEIFPEVRELAERFEDALQARINVNLYASWGDSPGFDIHWDTHDVFVLQVRGRKQWKLFAPTCRYPVRSRRDQAPRPSGDPTMEIALEEGGLLYLPRGWWHEAAATGGPSLHLTVAATPPIARNYLEWLIDRLEADVVGRMDVPRAAGAEAQACYFSRLREALLDHWVEGPERWLAEYDASRFARARFSLPALQAQPKALTDAARLRLGSNRRLFVLAGSQPNEIVIEAGAQRWPAHASLASAMRSLRSNTFVTYAELKAMLDDIRHERELRRTVLMLTASGAILVTGDG